MTKQIYIHCYGCMDYNKHHRDDKDYEMKTTRFESLTEAFEHMMETKHHMEIKLEEYEEE